MKEYQAALVFWNDFFKEKKPEDLQGASLGCTYLEGKLKDSYSGEKNLQAECQDIYYAESIFDPGIE